MKNIYPDKDVEQLVELSGELVTIMWDVNFGQDRQATYKQEQRMDRLVFEIDELVAKFKTVMP